jgi:hypothetical protein
MISPIRNEDLVLKVIPSKDSKKQIEKYDAFLDLLFDEEYYFLREAAYNILFVNLRPSKRKFQRQF